jgi:hypothetical protein
MQRHSIFLTALPSCRLPASSGAEKQFDPCVGEVAGSSVGSWPALRVVEVGLIRDLRPLQRRSSATIRVHERGAFADEFR